MRKSDDSDDSDYSDSDQQNNEVWIGFRKRYGGRRGGGRISMWLVRAMDTVAGIKVTLVLIPYASGKG